MQLCLSKSPNQHEDCLGPILPICIINLPLRLDSVYLVITHAAGHKPTKPLARLSIVRRSRNITATAGPVDVNVLALWVLLAGVFWLDAESVGTEVITLCLEEVGWEVLCPEAVVKGQSGGESWSWDTPEGTLGDDVSPAWLGLVDGVVEEIAEEQVLEIWVLAVCVGDVLEEDRSDDAATAPHEGDLWLVELPAVLLGGL